MKKVRLTQENGYTNKVTKKEIDAVAPEEIKQWFNAQGYTDVDNAILLKDSLEQQNLQVYEWFQDQFYLEQGVLYYIEE